ncbi:MAG: universal stress protein [Desulfobacteraceae bacterium]|jgi:nucleotide-binding universal stress UspA family protein
MLPFRRILAPTDFSEPSLSGLRAAGELARENDADLLLIHVVAPVRSIPPTGPPVHSGFEMSSVMEELEEAALESLDGMVEERTREGIRARGQVVQGNPAEEIAAAAERENADVIVIATHGWTGWRRFVFGSVAEKVVRLASCPVLTIPVPESSSPAGSDGG